MKRLGYSKIWHMGRLANNLFTIASLHGLARKFGYEAELPSKWNYWESFKNRMKVGEKLPLKDDINEPFFEYPGDKWWENALEAKKDLPVVSISGWLQSPLNWDNDRDFARNLFEWKDEFAYPLYIKYRELYEANKETIAITVRVGDDYKVNGNYEILPLSYYLGALYEKFPSWKDYNILVFGDDMEYLRLNFTHENMYIIDEGDIQQLFLASKCKHFILANSTFSWWASYLSAGEGRTVYPSKYFKGGLENTSTRDFWLPEWEKFAYDYRMDFSDVTFTIPVTYDHPDRIENFDMCIDYLQKHLDTNIIVGERVVTDSHFDYKEDVWHHRYTPTTFHRTHILNELSNEAGTKYIVNMDADVFIPLLQMCLAVDKLREGASMVYPYDGRFARVERVYVPKFKEELDCGYFKRTSDFRGCRDFDPPSYGGAIFWNKEDFVYGGMENENMINYGPEDYERYHRFTSLGYKVVRIKGIIYHMDHWVGPNSGGGGNEHFDPNHREYDRIKAMGNEELQEEIIKWPWMNKYLTGYYEEITEGSVRSAEHIYKTIIKELAPNSIIDIGSGIGGWLRGFRNAGYLGEYNAVDHKIPRHKLEIPVEDYQEYDLTTQKPFPFDKRYDLAICVEMAEHIPEEYADGLIKLLASLSNNVLFSAAIPKQGGNNHYNEQWQSYWRRKFIDNRMYPIEIGYDYLRKNKNIEPWYRQNIVMYSSKNVILTNGGMCGDDYVLPEMYTNIVGSLTEWR